MPHLPEEHKYIEFENMLMHFLYFRLPLATINSIPVPLAH